MPACNCYTDPIDRALHEAGVCTCALYTPRPPQQRLTIPTAEHLLGLMGFALVQLPNGRYIAEDEARGIQVPTGATISTAHAEDDLAGLVVRAGCAHRLDGPMTIAEATKILTGLGFELKTRMHPTYGRQWWAVSQRLGASTCDWLCLRTVVMAAQAIRSVERYRVRQRDIPAILEQLPRDLDPKRMPRHLNRLVRPRPPGVELAAPVPQQPPRQTGLDLHTQAPGPGAPRWQPPGRRRYRRK
jgi:hypothetical protein